MTDIRHLSVLWDCVSNHPGAFKKGLERALVFLGGDDVVSQLGKRDFGT